MVLMIKKNHASIVETVCSYRLSEAKHNGSLQGLRFGRVMQPTSFQSPTAVGCTSFFAKEAAHNAITAFTVWTLNPDDRTLGSGDRMG